eukprot:CFRG4026T1
MEEEELYSGSLEDRLVSKVWKVRQAAYKEISGLLKTCNENDPMAKSYEGEVSKWIVETNAITQEDAYDAVIAYVDAFGCPSPMFATSLMEGLVSKAFTSRPKTRVKAQNLCLLLTEVGGGNAVADVLINQGSVHKTPKVASGSAEFLTLCLKTFGSKPYDIKLIGRALVRLFEHKDASVRDHTHKMAVQVFRAAGRAAMNQWLDGVKAIQIADLEKDFAKAEYPLVPERHLRSENPANNPRPDARVAEDVHNDVGEEEDAVDYTEPYNFLAHLPEDFYSNIDEKKWSLRRNACVDLKKITDHPKLVFTNEIPSLLAKLANLIGDVNVMVVVEAAACIEHIAKGSSKDFGTEAISVLNPIFKRMKEKKANVLAALNEAAKAVLKTVKLDLITPELLPYIVDKNPSIRKEVLTVTAFAVRQTSPQILNKSLLKTLTVPVIKAMNDAVGDVREAAYETAGALLRVTGERAMAVYMNDLDKLKEEKVRHYFKLCTDVKAAPTARGPRARALPEKTQVKPALLHSSMPKPFPAPAVRTPVDATARPLATKRPTPSPTTTRCAVKFPGVDDIDDEAALDDDTITTLSELAIPEDIRGLVSSKLWKERIAGMEKLLELVRSDNENVQLSPQVIFRYICNTPSFNEANFQVWGKMFAVITHFCNMQPHRVTRRAASYVIPGLVGKIGDMKCGKGVHATLMSLSEAVGQSYVGSVVAQVAAKGTNPKNLAGGVAWFGDAITEFGLKSDMKMHVTYIKECLSHSNATVRKEAVQLLRVVFTHTGENYRIHFDDQKAATLENVDLVLKAAMESTPEPPTRFEYQATDALKSSTGVSPQSQNITEGVAAMDMDSGTEKDDDVMQEVSVGYQFQQVNNNRNVPLDEPRVDVSGKFDHYLCSAINNVSWKERQEAMDKVQIILKQSGKHITADVGDVPTALKARLHDSNKNLITMALQTIAMLVESMGPGCERLLKVLLPGVLSALSDKKLTITAAAINVLSSFVTEIGPLPLLDSVNEALESNHSQLRIQLMSWLVEVLKRECVNLPPNALQCLVQCVLKCTEDRLSGVRTLVQTLLPYIVKNCGYQYICQQVDLLRVVPATKATMLELILKFRDMDPALSSQVPEMGSIRSISTYNGATYKRKLDDDHKGAPTKSAQYSHTTTSSMGIKRSLQPGGGSVTGRGAPGVGGVGGVRTGLVRPSAASGLVRPSTSYGTSSSYGVGGAVGMGSPRRSGGGVGSSIRSNVPRPGTIPKSMGYNGGVFGIEDLDGPPLMLLGGDVRQREMANKRNKWECAADGPRNDQVVALKEQMLSCVKEHVVTQMWAADQRQHHIALDVITAAVKSDHDAQTPGLCLDEAISCCDVLLKYASVRLCDTNTTSMLKTLALLRAMVDSFIQYQHSLSDYEVSIILPILVVKIGEKEMVQKEARALIRCLCTVHPSSKIFVYLMDGIKSKNAKVRAASIEEIGYLINRYTISVCQPSPQVAINTIGQVLEDKDKNVRDMAMNVIVMVHATVGDEKIWRYLGQLSNRSTSYLQERLKRVRPGSGVSAGSPGRRMSSASPNRMGVSGVSTPTRTGSMSFRARTANPVSPSPSHVARKPHTNTQTQSNVRTGEHVNYSRSAGELSERVGGYDVEMDLSGNAYSQQTNENSKVAHPPHYTQAREPETRKNMFSLDWEDEDDVFSDRSTGVNISKTMPKLAPTHMSNVEASPIYAPSKFNRNSTSTTTKASTPHTQAPLPPGAGYSSNGNSNAMTSVLTNDRVAPVARTQSDIMVLTHLTGMTTDNPVEAVKALKECARSLNVTPEKWTALEFEELLSGCTLHLRRICTVQPGSFSGPLGDPAVSARLCRHTVHAIQQIYSTHKHAVRNIKAAVVENLLMEVIQCTTSLKSSRDGYGDRDRTDIDKALASLVPMIVRTHDLSLMLVCLQRCVNRSARTEHPEVVFVLTSLQKEILKPMRDDGSPKVRTIDWSALFVELNNFLQSFPVDSWKNKLLLRKIEEDRPMQAVKMTLSVIIRADGQDCLSHLSLVGSASPLALYIEHMLHKLDKENGSRDAFQQEIVAIASVLPDDLFENAKRLAKILYEHPEGESTLEKNIKNLPPHFQTFLRTDIQVHIVAMKKKAEASNVVISNGPSSHTHTISHDSGLSSYKDLASPTSNVSSLTSYSNTLDTSNIISPNVSQIETSRNSGVVSSSHISALLRSKLNDPSTAAVSETHNIIGQSSETGTGFETSTISSAQSGATGSTTRAMGVRDYRIGQPNERSVKSTHSAESVLTTSSTIEQQRADLALLKERLARAKG